MHTITLNGAEVEYELRTSKRSRGVRLSLRPGKGLVVTKPRLVPTFLVENFLHKKADWILKHVERIKNTPDYLVHKGAKREFEKHKDKALVLAHERLEQFNKFYNFTYKKVTVRNQKTRWGSCSRTGTISFSYRIALLPKELADYIVVHELCHLGAFNHSRAFWALVEKTVPNHRELRAHLRGRLS
ncbi:M48 family peptidase [bacterium]|nr:M48 family peptidase [bacterium]